MATGRGRLSSIDLLPAEADPIVQWAVEELQASERTQADILFEMNDRLAAIGCDAVSSSAFNRYSTRLAATTRQLKETREIAKAVTERLGPDTADDINVMLVEMLKSAIYAVLRGGKITSKEVMELSRGLQTAMSAQKMSADTRRRQEAEIASRINDVVDAAGKAAGLSAERIAQMRRELLGVRNAPAAGASG